MKCFLSHPLTLLLYTIVKKICENRNMLFWSLLPLCGSIQDDNLYSLLCNENPLLTYIYPFLYSCGVSENHLISGLFDDHIVHKETCIISTHT